METSQKAKKLRQNYTLMGWNEGESVRKSGPEVAALYCPLSQNLV